MLWEMFAFTGHKPAMFSLLSSSHFTEFDTSLICNDRFTSIARYASNSFNIRS